MQWIKQLTMQVTGSNINNTSDIILSIRVTPSGLYYSMTKHESVETLNYVPFTSNDVEAELTSSLVELHSNYSAVNVIIDTSDVILTPENLISIDEYDSARKILELNTINIPQSATPIITESKHGVRALMAANSAIVKIFKDNFDTVKFYATILSDILMDIDSIAVTFNDCSTSISCCVGNRLLYADVMSSNIEINTLLYCIQSVRLQFESKNTPLPVYVSGSQSSAILEQIQAIIHDVHDVSCLNWCVVPQRADINNYNDLIRLSK